MNSLNGKELQGYIKERQAKQVRRLQQARGIKPKLVILSTNDDKVSGIYTDLKKQYGEDIQIDVAVTKVTSKDIEETIKKLNNDQTVHGIIVQLPLAANISGSVLELITGEKDVDSLGSHSKYVAATPLAITWLLDGYNIELNNQEIAIVGQGQLVGKPLANLWNEQKFNVSTYDISSENMADELKHADVVITAVGRPGLITAELLKKQAIVVDAGVAEQDGQVKGDLADDVYDREDLTVTPQKGGVGPLTVSALFENVIKSAQQAD